MVDEELETVTDVTRRFLHQDIEYEQKRFITTPQTSPVSVLQRAHEAGLSLEQYVQEDPEQVLHYAEEALAYWLDVQGKAAISGLVDGARLTRNNTHLIELQVQASRELLDKVEEYTLSTLKTKEKRVDHILRTMYKRGVRRGDSKSLIYLINRVEGTPSEARTPEIDYDNAYNVFQIIHTLFDKQLEVLNVGNGTAMICCSRRSGKTHLFCAAVLIEALRQPNTICLYIGKTMKLIEQVVESTINVIVDKCKLRDKTGRRLNWKKLDNGSKILVRGLSNTSDPDMLRGFKAKVIVIDEFFHLRDELLQYFRSEVLVPMQMDYANDYKFLCGGTPPRIKGTYGEKAWKEWDVPHFFWTYKENPFPSDPELREQFVLDALAEEGHVPGDTFARREFGGEWVYDEDLLLYPEVHTYDIRVLPTIHVDMVLFGIDYGVSDCDALIGIAWDTQARSGFVFNEDKFNRLDIKDRTVSQLEYLKGRIMLAWERALDFFPTLTKKEANKRILWDADDNNQHISEDFTINLRLEDLRMNIRNAHKDDKVMLFDKIRDLFRTGNLLLPEGGATYKECEMTCLRRGAQGQVYPDVDSRIYHPDLLPALRYALWNVIGQETPVKVKGE